MTSRLGRCWNQDYCQLAQAGAVLRIEEPELFVCPECARPLRAAVVLPAKRPGGLRTTLGGIGLVLVGAALLWKGFSQQESPSPAPIKPPVQAAVRKLASPVAVIPKPVPRVVPALVTAPIPPPAPAENASVLMRLRSEPGLAAVLLPHMAQRFLEWSGDADVHIRRNGDRTDIIGHSVAGPEAVTIIAAPLEQAFSSLTDGGAELVIATQPPSLTQAHTLPDLRQLNVAATPQGMATLFVPLPPDPVAVAFMEFTRSDAGHSAVGEAGFAPPAPPPAAVPPPVAAAVVAPIAAPKPMPKIVLKAPKPQAPPPPDAATQRPPPPAPPVPAATSANTNPPPPRATPPAPATAPTPAVPAAVAMTGPRIIRLPEGSSIRFGPLKDVDMPTMPSRMIFLPQGASHQAPGSMQVDCLVQTSGVPKDCRQISGHGASNVSGAILAWLGSGAIRYSPATKDGRKIEERRLLTVNFRQPTAPAE